MIGMLQLARAWAGFIADMSTDVCYCVTCKQNRARYGAFWRWAGWTR